MDNRTLIVARIDAADRPRIAECFAESDATHLPEALGVRRRILFGYQDLYFHYIEFSGDGRAAMERGAQDPEFARVSQRLRPFVEPYDPQIWRSPADAVATPFYRWTGPEPGTAP
ncbi:TcmI family type II polyketide cyclase [Nocardiopsis sp. RSe5-2]|uniref:TcmI family type II polyketide cyclase n=1 Tax=Nocardiopsis endophytica TaxID=3018445 RepID=A0ABT4U7U2_9ACTN|nr:TcmI family type II polyketide cyclase [Nocardiopsis endophytica]MDA2813001.1 TcmI family type II polyketide cyclase [Nocardiopsis endophytica]